MLSGQLHPSASKLKLMMWQLPWNLYSWCRQFTTLVFWRTSMTMPKQTKFTLFIYWQWDRRLFPGYDKSWHRATQVSSTGHCTSPIQLKIVLTGLVFSARDFLLHIVLTQWQLPFCRKTNPKFVVSVENWYLNLRADGYETHTVRG